MIFSGLALALRWTCGIGMWRSLSRPITTGTAVVWLVKLSRTSLFCLMACYVAWQEGPISVVVRCVNFHAQRQRAERNQQRRPLSDRVRQQHDLSCCTSSQRLNLRSKLWIVICGARWGLRRQQLRATGCKRLAH